MSFDGLAVRSGESCSGGIYLGEMIACVNIVGD